MNAKMLANLERPVNYITAVKKVAAIQGHEGREGGWIYTAGGLPIVQGWDNYGRRHIARNVLFEDPERPGKFYIWALGLSAKALRRAEEIFG